jgi:heat shock protein beta
MRIDRWAVRAVALLALSHVPFSNHGLSRALVSAEAEAVAEDPIVADATITADCEDGTCANPDAIVEEEPAVVVEEEEAFVPPQNAEHFKFEAEVAKMLDIVVNSLYENKDVFLRELISNASDALDKIRFLSLTNPELLAGQEELKVEIEYDPDQHTLTVRDTGIGMTHDEMIQNLGTVARSGTTKFLQSLKESGSKVQSGDISQIGQFGVGFYSAFLVADRVQVASKHPESDGQNIWTAANGSSEFQVYPDPRGNTLGRGTEITLFLKEDCVEYADPKRLRDLAVHYSEFITHPIQLRTFEEVAMELNPEDLEDLDGETILDPQPVTTASWERLNENQAIWTRSKEDISDEEYQAFWHVVSKNDVSSAATWSHFNAEGNINFKAIVYLPEDLPESYKFGNIDRDAGGMSLYVRKVLISDKFDLLPRYLNFVRGVVDSDDLPLNVNRETLQESKIIQVIKKKVVRKILEMIRNFMKEHDGDDEEEAEVDEDGNVIEKEDKPKDNAYLRWYEKYAPSMKMGAMDDEPNRKKLLKFLRYRSSKSDKEWISLDKYVKGMKEWQNEIYYMAGINLETVEKSQFLEPFKEKDVEVLYFTDAVDEYMIGHIRDFEGKKFVNIASESVKFKDEEDKDLATRRDKYYKKKFKPLTKWLKKLYGASVMRVVVSKRLGSAPAIASSSEHGHSANMERIMRAQAFNHGQEEFAVRALKIFEINPRHPLVIKLLEACPSEDDIDSFKPSEDVEDAGWILHEMALLNGGFQLTDPQGHSKRMTKFLQKSLEVDSLTLEPELDLPALEEVAPEIDGKDEPMGTSPEDAIPLDLDDLDNIHTLSF